MSPSINAVSLYLPPSVRTNDYYQRQHAVLVEQIQAKRHRPLFSADDATNAFDRAMVPYQGDPFRGTVERHVAVSESSIDLEVKAGHKALNAAGVDADQIDLLLSTGFLNRDIGLGNAVHVADRLNLSGAAFNLESACGGALNAMMVACAFVASGTYDRVLVTTSCTYLQQAMENDPISWFLGDGAGAFIISNDAGAAYLGGYSMHTADTCGTWRYEIDVTQSEPRITLRASAATGRVMREVAEPHLRRCVSGVLRKLSLTLTEIDAIVTHTPTAWFADFVADALAFKREKVVNTFPKYANIGPALTPANLHEAGATNLLKSRDKVLLFAPGSSSSSVAIVLEWGNVALSD